MRNLLNIIDYTPVTLEGVGLANRRPGDKFKNHVGDIVTFQGLELYPDSGNYADATELDQAKLDATEKQGRNVHWVNQATAATRAFMIALFTGEDGSPYYLGRWVNSISPNKTQNKFAHNAIPGDFTFQGKAGQKENSGLKPSEWLTQFQNNTPQTILDQCIAKFGQGSDEANALQIFINSDIPCKIPKGNMNPTAFRDYFAEVLQPIALVMGKNVSGNAGEASEIFFGGGGYTDCTISFNTNTIGGLYDSLLVNPDGKQIKLSSKGKDGASASVVNLQKSVKELEGTANGKKLIAKHSDAVNLLDLIQKEGHFGAPLKLAIQYKMITPAEATQVLGLKNYGPQDKIIGTGVLSPKLEKMYQARQAADPKRIIPIEHMIAAIAYPVADHVNKNTNFGSAASEILNNAALVQMYTDTSVSGDTITVTKLTAVYPSQTVTGVLLDASKVYYSTGGKGNYTFTILKNGAKLSDVNPMDPVDRLAAGPGVDTSKPEELDAATQARSNVKAASAPERLGTEKSLGRKRQR